MSKRIIGTQNLLSDPIGSMIECLFLNITRLKTGIFEEVPNLSQTFAMNVSITFFSILTFESSLMIRTENPCKTPDNFNGTCVAVKQCRPISRVLKTDLSTEQRNFLRNSQCGREGDDILVCCPNSFTIEDLPSTKYCGTQVADKIVGGGETSINEYPWYESNLKIKSLRLQFF